MMSSGVCTPYAGADAGTGVCQVFGFGLHCTCSRVESRNRSAVPIWVWDLRYFDPTMCTVLTVFWN